MHTSRVKKLWYSKKWVHPSLQNDMEHSVHPVIG